MSKEPFIISCFTAEKDYSDLNLPTNHNKSDLEIVSDILLIHDVVVLPQPSENCCSDLWKSEKKKICGALVGLKDRKRKRRSQGDLNFYNSQEYSNLTKYVPPKNKTVDPDFDHELANSDDSDDDTKPLGRPFKPLTIDSQKFIALTKEIKEKIVALCDAEGIDVGPTVAKIGSAILHNAKNKKHYNPKQGMIFTKIAKGEDISQGAKFSHDDGLYLYSSLEIGRDRYTDLKQFCSKHKVNLPCHSYVKRRKLEYVPVEKLQDCFEQGTILLICSQLHSLKLIKYLILLPKEFYMVNRYALKDEI